MIVFQFYNDLKDINCPDAWEHVTHSRDKKDNVMIIITQSHVRTTDSWFKDTGCFSFFFTRAN